MMTKEEICEVYGIEEPVVFLEPHEVYGKGILGVTEDHCHIIYGYYALISALAEDYEKQWIKDGSKGEKPDFEMDAVEWIDYNTIRGINATSMENEPIIMIELMD